MKKRHIVAMGGGSLLPGTPASIESYFVRLTGKTRPRVCLLPTAGGENRDWILRFFEAFGALGCDPFWLSLFTPQHADVESYLLGADAIFVSGGNTKSMLALWREWKLDSILRTAWENGVVLGGTSAGANCWFEQCTTDSIPGDLTVMSCLGFLPGSFTPHYDAEVNRRPALTRFVASGEIKEGYAADNNAALHFVGSELHRALRCRADAHAFRLRRAGGRAEEEPLAMFDAADAPGGADATGGTPEPR